VILDFEVADVDAEYARLQESVSDWVMLPKSCLGAPALSYFAIRTEISSICSRIRDGAFGGGASCQGPNAGGPERQLAKLDELSARANVETDRIEALNRRVVVAGRVTAALLLISAAALAAARFL